MNALEVAARGIAARALSFADGAVSLRQRTADTAAALEELAKTYPALAGYAGDTYTVETAPYLTGDRVVIRGNGAELRNVNPVTPTEGGERQVALPLGTSTVWYTQDLTYYPVLSASDTTVTLAAGEGAAFAPGDLVILRGANSYHIDGYEYDIYRNYLRARVLSSTADTVTVDRPIRPALLADGPLIANAGEELDWALDGAPRNYLLFAPHVSNLRLSSLLGEAWKWGGVIDGVFRDIELDARNGVVFNAMQDCRFDNIRFRGWRKALELAEGSCNTVVRGLRGHLFDNPADRPNFFLGIHENSTGCVVEDVDIDTGNCRTIYDWGVGAQLGSGSNNVIRKGVLRFPAHTGTGLSIQSRPEPGHSAVDCGFENLDVHLPNGQTFFSIGDGGAGTIRPFLRNVRFFGAVSIRAAAIAGDGGVLDGVWCEAGGLMFNGNCDNWTIRNCYFPRGFENLSLARLQSNRISDNESDASRRLNAAANITLAQQTINGTAPNATYKSATFAAGDLGSYDTVHVRTIAYSAGGSTSNRNGRVTVKVGGVETVIAVLTQTANARPMGFEIELHVKSATSIAYKARYASGGVTITESEGTFGVASLDANALTVGVQYWVDNASDAIGTQSCRIIPVKPGMNHLPLC